MPIVLLVVAALALVAPIAARAQCQDPRDANALVTAIKKASACRDRVLAGRGPCTKPVPAPPTCAGTLAADALALAYGANAAPPGPADGRDYAAQRRCQTSIAKGVAEYAKALGLVIRGRTSTEAEASARRALDKLVTRCAVAVARHPSDTVVPAVGPQCAAAVGAPGTPVDAPALRDCLVTLMRAWVGRVVPEPQPLRPNVVLVLTDDQRWDTIGTTHSPNAVPIMPGVLRELAGEGVSFDNAFMTTPLCCPSRASILTGSYAHRTGVYSNSGTNGGAPALDDTSTLATWLQDAGYRTIFLGKYLNGYTDLWDAPAVGYVPPGWSDWAGFRTPRYFDFFLIRQGAGFPAMQQVQYTGTANYSTDVLRELAKEFIVSSAASGQPFFLYLNVKAPHGPWDPAPRHLDKYAGIPAWRPPSWNEVDVSDKPAWLQNTPPLTPTQVADLDLIRQRQLEMLQAVDEAIGGSEAFGITGIVQTLRDAGVAENTLVVYFADNGWHWGEHRTQAKLKPYEESIRSPMFVRYPALAPLPRTETRMALNIDLAPTIAELAGVGVPIAHDGASLVRVLDGTAPAWREDFLTEGWPASRVWATVREAQWKYTELPVDPGNPDTTFEQELYDLVTDPLELENLAGDPAHAARIATMAARLRVLRPNWPLDADPQVELPEEEED